MFIQLILKKSVYFFSIFGFWLRVSTKFFSSKVSSSNAIFAATFSDFGGLTLILNVSYIQSELGIKLTSDLNMTVSQIQ